MTQIKNIIFDFGGILLPVNYDNISNGFERMGVSNAKDFYSQQTQVDIFDQIERGQISGAEFLSELHQKISNHSELEILETWNSILGELPDFIPSFLSKVSQHYKIYLLSNTNELHQVVFEKNIKERFHENLSDWFENVYYSHLTGFRKPEPEIFNLVLLENNLNPHETLFVEDTIQNVKGAAALEINCLFVDVKNGDKTLNYFEENGKLISNLDEKLWKA